MRFSVFTPSYDVRFLLKAMNSLKQQNFPKSNWEWVIYLNGLALDQYEEYDALTNGPVARVVIEDPSDPSNIIRELKKMGNVKIYLDDPTDTDTGIHIGTEEKPRMSIGALKKKVTSYCEGEYLLELDHDDELTINALEIINESIVEQNQPDFLYGHCLVLDENDESVLYDTSGHHPVWGKRVRNTIVNGNEYAINLTPEISPESLSNITTAPDHPRVFKKIALDEAGGYDQNLPVNDDQELMIRMYYKGMRFYQIDKCLYIYHKKGQNTCYQAATNNEITWRSVSLAQSYHHLMASAWGKKQKEENGKLLVDMGGQFNNVEGWYSVDKSETDEYGNPIDYVVDVTEGLPKLEDNSVAVIRAWDFLEHIPQDKVQPLMEEFYRILMPGGYLLTNTPDTRHAGGQQDPDHKSWWVMNKFYYFADVINGDDPNYKKYNPTFKAKFQVACIYDYWPSDWHQQQDIFYIHANLRAVKPGYVPFAQQSANKRLW